MKFHLLTPLQLSVIDSIIALNEDEQPPQDLEKYIAAFDESLDPSRAFTLHSPAANEINLIYNIEANRSIRWMEKQEFSQLCKRTVHTLVEIADFWQSLASEGYINGEYRDRPRQVIPADQLKNWRRYQGFNPLEMTSLLYGRSIRPIPRLKLYRFWESLRETQAAVE